MNIFLILIEKKTLNSHISLSYIYIYGNKKSEIKTIKLAINSKKNKKKIKNVIFLWKKWN